MREIFRALPEMSGPENDAVRAQQLELAGQAVVQEQVKGLWMLEEGVYVVEGECPVSPLFQEIQRAHGRSAGRRCPADLGRQIRALEV